MSVLVVRHGETAWAVAHRHTGRADVPLTEAGRADAAALAAPLAAWPLALVLVSPLTRAVTTAQLAGIIDGAERVDDLLEWDYGRAEGRTREDVQAELPGWDLWTDGGPDGERPQDVRARVDRVVARLAPYGDAGGPHAAVVAHGHVLRALAARWLDAPVELGRRLALDTAHVGVLGRDRGGTPVLQRWNGPVPALDG
ncbi:histidine phosphatase family protein [Paraconexibacter algicola]|uniref:Histidine phosphatase family protein n=1 Tax=Paraconexibacter algicola TaxID=2133960 RepID=A0A2T4UMM1_9ACTN|nr:histidine phosphatase family protein [Paraconexibacter algicola]PTL60451.1 histidine phosphatase family protein [Paraconexibacter algicola]